MAKTKGTAYNTYDQIKQAGGDGVFISRGRHQCSWAVHRLVNGRSVKTDPNAAWFHGGCKVFYAALAGTPRERVAAALAEAQAWVLARYGEAGPWVRNRMGDWLPARIHKAHPLRPLKEPE